MHHTRATEDLQYLPRVVVKLDPVVLAAHGRTAMDEVVDLLRSCLRSCRLVNTFGRSGEFLVLGTSDTASADRLVGAINGGDIVTSSGGLRRGRGSRSRRTMGAAWLALYAHARCRAPRAPCAAHQRGHSCATGAVCCHAQSAEWTAHVGHPSAALRRSAADALGIVGLRCSRARKATTLPVPALRRCRRRHPVC